MQAEANALIPQRRPWEYPK